MAWSRDCRSTDHESAGDENSASFGEAGNSDVKLLLLTNPCHKPTLDTPALCVQTSAELVSAAKYFLLKNEHNSAAKAPTKPLRTVGFQPFRADPQLTSPPQRRSQQSSAKARGAAEEQSARSLLEEIPEQKRGHDECLLPAQGRQIGARLT